MLQVNPAFAFEKNDPKLNPKLVLQLALMGAFSFLWVGCSTLSQGSAPSSQTSPQSGLGISIQTTLPSASLGSSYHEVLSVSGGLPPYFFAVSQGQLPPGLVLTPQTGSISGTPTQVGNFAFTISVTAEQAGTFGAHTSLLSDGPVAASGARAYTVTVAPCAKCVTVQISPSNPSVVAGGKVQFAAVVSNTSNTAVTWSASAGTVSASGLFTAPTNTSAKSITVTASSAAQSTAQASTAVTITSTAFTITTSNVPSATEATLYSASLTASGGQPPYQWSIVSGSLPAGLQLNASTGTLSGSPTQAGTFTFSVRGTDAASQTALQSFSLLVSAPAQTCGPPAYSCSRTDLNIVQVPSTPPSVGNLVGANTIVTDPNFGNRIVRITDTNTNPSASTKNFTYVTSSSGSADDNLWNIDSTLFIVQDTGSAGYPFTFTPSTLQAARMYVSSFPATNGFTLSDDGNWSRVNPNILYTYQGTAINKYDFTDRTNPPSPQSVYDFTSSPNCLPAGFTETWSTKGGVSGNDTVFAMGYSNSGIQGTGVYAVVYKVGSGCSALNTQTGQVTGDWGVKGAINIADRWTVHNVKLSKDGNWLVVAPQNCTSPSCSKGPYFWQIGTTNVGSCGDGGMCSGHWTEGYTHWVNNNNSPLSNQAIRSFADWDDPSALTHTFPSGMIGPLDQHQSWNNVDPNDTLPFMSSTWSTVSPFPAPWYNEIIAVAADGSGTTWRFAHSFITARSQRFSTEYAIGTVSQDGKFFIFSSDWMGSLGSESGATTCTIGTNCRGDVFVVELR
jgi:Putative Ig domain